MVCLRGEHLLNVDIEELIDIEDGFVASLDDVDEHFLAVPLKLRLEQVRFQDLIDAINHPPV